jgi:hypothetical protein
VLKGEHKEEFILLSCTVRSQWNALGVERGWHITEVVLVGLAFVEHCCVPENYAKYFFEIIYLIFT